MISWLTSFWARLRHALGRGGGDAIDPDVRDIFLSELDEISTSLNALLPAWRGQRTDAATLREIRRSFHTLKGSGLAVGANQLAAFCSRVEKLVVHLIERPASAPRHAIPAIEQAIELLPACSRALQGGTSLPNALRKLERSIS